MSADPARDLASAEPTLASPPGDRPPDTDPRVRPSLGQRVIALIEVILCSDYPTQTALGGTFTAFGFSPYVGGRLSVAFVVLLSLVDTILLLGLVVFFLWAHGERPRDVFLGRRPAGRETWLGIWPCTAIALLIGAGTLALIQYYAPSLHTVEHNPLQELIRTPRDAWLFALVVVVAGGIREELQRAFLVHRFEVWLGGATFGVVAVSIAFGAGHLLQGVDATIATGALGAFWAIVYLRRRSVVAPVVSHSTFNLLQIAQFMATGR
jgi:membrane protease YdiL (CAAX protease family)